MPSKKELKRQIKLRDEVIGKQLDTIDVLKRIIDKIYPEKSESFQDKVDKDISHPLPYKRAMDQYQEHIDNVFPSSKREFNGR